MTRSYESNGPDVKIRGNAHHVAEKYLQLARDAQSSGDPVGAESYLQHAEHYFRLIASYQQTQQPGYGRQVEDGDEDGDDENSLPDRFASPQAPAPFVPQQPQAQPYAGDRQQAPYGGGERNQGGERPPHGDRNNGYGQRQDRNGQDRNGQNGQRRPFRDDRHNEPRVGGDARNGEFRNHNDRRNGYERMQERVQQQERFNTERGGYREGQPDPSRDPYAGEQPRLTEQPRLADRAESEQPLYRPDVGAPVEGTPRAAAPPRAVAEDAPGLPSFITTPTRTVAAEPGPSVESSSVPAFPGDAEADAPKFPRRRRRPPRAIAGEGDETPAEQQPAVD